MRIPAPEFINNLPHPYHSIFEIVEGDFIVRGAFFCPMGSLLGPFITVDRVSTLIHVLIRAFPKAKGIPLRGFSSVLALKLESFFSPLDPSPMSTPI